MNPAGGANIPAVRTLLRGPPIIAERLEGVSWGYIRY
jgi:hypothetical protein